MDRRFHMLAHRGLEIKFKRHFIPAEIRGFLTFKWHIYRLKIVDLDHWIFQKSGFSRPPIT